VVFVSARYRAIGWIFAHRAARFNCQQDNLIAISEKPGLMVFEAGIIIFFVFEVYVF